MSEGSQPPKLRQVYRTEQVKSHCTPNDLWMIVYNKVYDLTTFIEKHPGGIEVMIDCGGVDATEAFEDVAHSDDALEMLDPYFIGVLHADEHKEYQTARAKFREADIRARKLRQEQMKLDRQKKRTKTLKKHVERVTMGILTFVAFGTVIFYFTLQRFKLSLSDYSMLVRELGC